MKETVVRVGVENGVRTARTFNEDGTVSLLVEDVIQDPLATTFTAHIAHGRLVIRINGKHVNMDTIEEGPVYERSEWRMGRRHGVTERWEPNGYHVVSQCNEGRVMEQDAYLKEQHVWHVEFEPPEWRSRKDYVVKEEASWIHRDSRATWCAFHSMPYPKNQK